MYIVRLTRYDPNEKFSGWALRHREVKTNAKAQEEFEELKKQSEPQDEVTIHLNGMLIHYWVNKGERNEN